MSTKWIEIFDAVKDWKNLNAEYTDVQLSPAVIQKAEASGTLLYSPGVKCVIVGNNPRKNFWLVPGKGE